MFMIEPPTAAMAIATIIESTMATRIQMSTAREKLFRLASSPEKAVTRHTMSPTTGIAKRSIIQK